MSFWEMHDLVLLELKKKAVQLREEFERKNGFNDAGYHKRLNQYINRRIGKPTDSLCKLSMAYTVGRLDPKNIL